jgi:hypothetical protein
MDDNEFEAYVSVAVQELKKKLGSMAAKYKLESLPRWACDLTRHPATLEFFDKGDKPALVCEVIELGTFLPESSTWRWGWSNESLPPKVRAQALPLKRLQEITGRDYFGFEEAFLADTETVRDLVAISVKHLSALGCYDALVPDAEEGELYAFLAIVKVRPRA